MARTQIFLSHRSSQKPFLKARLIPKLVAARFEVWLEEREIDLLEPITEEIRQAIAESHLFLAWWFDGYEESEPCHFELITALAHCRAEGEHSHQQRVFFAGPDAAGLFPEAGNFKGLLAPKLSDPPTEAQLNALVYALKSRAGDAVQPFGATKLDKANREAIAPNTNFVGRAKELLQLFGRMHAGRAGTEGGGDAVTLVSGMGGEGKTELAKEFARRFRAWYPGGVYRINLPGDAGDWAASGAALDQALANIADDFGIIRPENATRRFVRGLIGEMLTTPYLWLVDDIRGGVSAEDLVDFLPPNSHGTCLLTGRAAVPGLANFKLDELSQDEGMRLLARSAAGRLTKADRAELYSAVNGHALSLNLIGHGIAAGLTADEFLTPVTPLMDRLEEIADTIDRERLGLKPVLPTLLVSLRLIPEDHPARQVLALIAHLASAPVPLDLLTQALDRASRVRAISFLEHRGLLTRDTRQTEACLRLHPLLAEVVRALPEEFGTAESLNDRLAAVDGVLLADLQAVIKDAGHFRRNALTRMLLPHARHRAAVGLREARPDLAAYLGYALHALGELSGARALLVQVVEGFRRSSGPQHTDTLASLNNLANTLYAQGDLSGARALYEQVLEARRGILGPEHPDTLESLNDLAVALQALGELASARALQEQALEARRRVLGRDHPDTLESLNDLAVTLQALGELTSARALQEQVLEIRRRVLGREHPETLRVLNNLAYTLQALGDLSGARALQEQALEARRRILGPEHPSTLSSLSRLGSILRALGDLSGARALQEEALEARRRILGPEHPSTLSSLSRLARTIRDQGDQEQAQALFETVLEGRRRVLGLEHPRTLSTLSRLARLLRDKGDLKGARALFEQLLQLRRRILGLEHPDTLHSTLNLTKLLISLGEPSTAVSLMQPLVPLVSTIPNTQVRSQLIGLISKLGLSSELTLSPDDVIDLAFYLTLAGELEPDKLLTLADPAAVDAALKQSVEDAPGRLAALRKRFDGIRPDPLWRAWLHAVHVEASKALARELSGPSRV